MQAQTATETVEKTGKLFLRLLILAFLCARFGSLLAMPLEGLRGYGDFPHYFNVASLSGWPFLDYWMEYPPLFPFLTALLFRLAGGQEHVFDYLLFFVLSLADAGNLYLFARLAFRLHERQWALLRTGAYLVILLTLAYSWWYFDSLVVFCMLLAASLLFEKKSQHTGAVVGLGILTKFFPGFTLIAAWRRFPVKQLVRLAAFSLLPVIVVWGLLFIVSPDFTAASLTSQGSKGSWETVWALLDGNIRTGSFGSIIERLDPQAAGQLVGQPALISPWITLVAFAGLGLWGLLKARPTRDIHSLALLGFGWCLFLLWSPGWSPQWVLYLLPLVLLVMDERQALLFALMFILVNLLEWPVLLSRGYFWALGGTVLLRMILLLLMAWEFYRRTKDPA